MAKDRSQHEELRQQVISAAIEEMRRVGPSRFRAATVTATFRDRGVHFTTLFRWIAAAMEAGTISQVVAGDIKRAAKRRAQKQASESSDQAAVLAEHLPAIVTLDDVAGAGPVRVIHHLQKCISTAHLVMRHATGEDGKPKLTKTLLAASEHLRRCLETAHRIAEQINELDRVEEFHRSIIEEVQKESPDCAHRILVRLDQFTTGSML